MNLPFFPFIIASLLFAYGVHADQPFQTSGQFEIAKDIHLLPVNPNIQRAFVSLKSSRGATSNILLLEPENPVASAILFAGGDGRISINEDGSMEKDANFLVRSRRLFAENGIRTAVIDPPSDHWHLLEQRTTDWHMQDIATVMAYLKSLSDKPVWLIGTSRGTISVAAAATRIDPQYLAGIVLTSTVTEPNKHDSVYATDISTITLPVLVVHHREDNCWVTPYSGAVKLMQHLSRAEPSELITFSGGKGGADDCGPISDHGFNGIERSVVTSIARWIQNLAK